MQKLVIAAIALISLAGPAVAGGLEPSDDAQSAWSFTGCYAGGHAGGLWGSSEKWIVRTQGGAFEGQSVGEHDLNGWIGGIQAGCDYQTAGGFLIGVQGDYGWSNDDGTHASAREIGVFYHSEIESLASVTAASATPSIASSATSKAGLPGSATPTRLRRSSSGLRIRQATRGRDGRLAAVANMPSTSLCPALSSSIISTSARPYFRVNRKCRI